MLPPFQRLCRLDELAEGRAHTVEVGPARVALVRVGDAVHALSARCPHANGPLGRGWVEDDALVCPLHRWRFRLADGRCETISGERVFRYPCEVREGEVWVAV